VGEQGLVLLKRRWDVVHLHLDSGLDRRIPVRQFLSKVLAEHRFCRQFCQRAVVEKVLIDEPEPAPLPQTGIGMAMHVGEVWVGGSRLNP